MNSLVYSSPVDSEEDLIARIVKAAPNIRQQPGIIEHLRQSLLRRRRLYIDVGGQKLEHLL
jgi:hypothetical protein